uniref:UBA domain-containing protein n=1 Tax=Sus scrofa TaxID=9823 RepID=A0A8D0PYQ0_PIG
MAELTALESLIEMGFPRGRAEKALALTGNQGIEAAMDWLMEHEDDPDVDEPLATPLGHVLGREPTPSEQSSPEGPGSAAGEGKPPLSEEERQEQTKRMLELLAQKQREREEREEREALERERQRRRQGQELSAARQRLQEDEMRRAAEERRREKAEELAARQRVREKIERDKAERAKKYGGSVGSQPPPPTTTEPGPVPASPSQEPPTKREYDQCRIQVLILIPVMLLGPLRWFLRDPTQPGAFFSYVPLCQTSPFFVNDFCNPISSALRNGIKFHSPQSYLNPHPSLIQQFTFLFVHNVFIWFIIQLFACCGICPGIWYNLVLVFLKL